MTKLRSTKFTKGQYANQDIELPGVGVVKFDIDGNIDVPKEKVAQLIKDTKDAFAFEEIVVKVANPTPPATTGKGAKDASKGKKELADAEDKLKKIQTAEVLSKEGEIADKPGPGEQENTNVPPVQEENPALTQLRADLEQADIATLVELAGDLPELAEIELAGKTDVELRELIIKHYPI